MWLSVAPWKLQEIHRWYWLVGNEKPRVILCRKPALICCGNCPPLTQLWPADPLQWRRSWIPYSFSPSLMFPSGGTVSDPTWSQAEGGEGEKGMGWGLIWLTLIMVLYSLGQQVGTAGSCLGHMEGSSDGSPGAVGSQNLHAAFACRHCLSLGWPLLVHPHLCLPLHSHPPAARASHSDKPLTFLSN